MNGYYYTLYRQKSGLNQYQDFIIGAVHKHQAMNVTDIIGMAKEHKVSSLFTMLELLRKVQGQLLGQERHGRKP
jgi:hypothetical protein